MTKGTTVQSFPTLTTSMKHVAKSSVLDAASSKVWMFMIQGSNGACGLCDMHVCGHFAAVTGHDPSNAGHESSALQMNHRATCKH